jgi:hypothetical protein
VILAISWCSTSPAHSPQRTRRDVERENPRPRVSWSTFGSVIPTFPWRTPQRCGPELLYGLPQPAWRGQ